MQLASSFLFFLFKRQEIDKELYIFGYVIIILGSGQVLDLLLFFLADDNDRGNGCYAFDLLTKTTGKLVLCFYI